MRDTAGQTTSDAQRPQWLTSLAGTAVLIVTVSLFTSGIRPLVGCIHGAREVVLKTRQYEQLVAANRQAEDDLEYRKTIDGKRRAAREELGYINAHEELIEPIEEVASDAGVGIGERLWAWLDDTGTRAGRWGRDVIDITKCMTGRWERVVPENEAALSQ